VIQNNREESLLIKENSEKAAKEEEIFSLDSAPSPAKSVNREHCSIQEGIENVSDSDMDD